MAKYVKKLMDIARRFHFFLIFAVTCITLYFSYCLSSELFTYLALRSLAPARISQWEIEEIKGKFALKAVYSFEAKGKIWNGSSFLQKPYYWNEPAAISALRIKAKEDWNAWYNPKNPAHSALERAYPIGLTFRTFICYGVLIYFFLLRLGGRKIIRI